MPLSEPGIGASPHFSPVIYCGAKYAAIFSVFLNSLNQRTESTHHSLILRKRRISPRLPHLVTKTGEKYGLVLQGAQKKPQVFLVFGTA